MNRRRFISKRFEEVCSFIFGWIILAFLFRCICEGIFGY